MANILTDENERLRESNENQIPWRRWGPYLSERQWGTVREDYSDNGSAWDYFSHDQARSRAYHWGEDGIAGISDDKQQLCFAIALWNGKDPILKERLFGLTNSEGNHGEDVKEYYFYLDSTPTHSYMKYLYKYPQNEFPYNDLIAQNRQRDRYSMEYELLDTKIFNDDRYFDVLVEYAKESTDDILVKITAFNRSKDTATLHLLPTLWFRNVWADGKNSKPILREARNLPNINVVEAFGSFGNMYLYCEGEVPLLFTENETNNQRLFNQPNISKYVKDGINDYVVNNQKDTVNPDKVGTKASAHYHIVIPPGESKSVRLRLNQTSPSKAEQQKTGNDLSLFGSHFEEVMNMRKQEADRFYDALTPASLNDDERQVMRQAFAGMLWSKQYYYYDVAQWLHEEGIDFYSKNRRNKRNIDWFHMVNDEVISMPDKWEYPWYAAWDLAFHTVTLSLVDPQFAKQQLELMLVERYMHPNGQIPAYEWNFSDVNPPVHAFAALFNYRLEQQLTGKGDIQFLENIFQKLLINFTWWVNRKDHTGSNVFEGGFLGLDNIGVFDRSAPLPPGVSLEQADGTAWMAMFCQNMLEIAGELAMYDPVYEEEAVKFFEHFLWIANAIQREGTEDSLWDKDNGFFFDSLRNPDGSNTKIKICSMVGLIALCANSVFSADTLKKLPKFASRVSWFTQHHPELVAHIHRPGKAGVSGNYLLSLLDDDKLKRVLSRMLDEKEFLGPYGIRSLSKEYAEHPYSIDIGGHQLGIEYTPAESTTGAFGGNSNWRGPVWFPINILILRALLNLYAYYGNDFKVECPTGSGKQMNLFEVSRELAGRLVNIFLRDGNGRRPVYGGTEKFQTDPYWKDNILFYEYFHGDNGAGLGASHQTGWTGLVSLLLKLYGTETVEAMKEGRTGLFKKLVNK